MIYFLAESLDSKDGGSRAAADWLQDLLELGRPLVVVSRARHRLPRRSDRREMGSVRWIVVPDSRPPSRPGSGVAPRAWARWGRATLRYHWRRARASAIPRLFPPSLAIHNEFPYPGTCAHQILRMAPRQMTIVHSSRDCIAYYLRGRKTLTTASVAAELSRMHGLAFVSPQLRDDWAEVADIAHVRQWVVSNTCREDEAAPMLAATRDELRASLGLPREAFVAVCVGYVHDGKGQDTLVAALPDLVSTVPSLIVVFVGNDTSEWAGTLKAAIAGMGMADRVRFTGLRPDPYAFIRAADLLIHPSRTEGQGLVLLEAMILRTPVLATNVGGIPSVITHRETGWLVPPDDPGALLEAFRTLAGSAELRSGLAERAELEYWTRFHRAEHRERIRAIVDGMLDSQEP